MNKKPKTMDDIANSEWLDSVILENYSRVKKTAYYTAIGHGCRSPEQWAEDMTQEVFLRLSALMHKQKLQEHPNITAWLLKTLANVIGSDWQKKSRQEIPVAEVWSIRREPVCSMEITDELFPAGLTAEEREILLLCRCQGLSHEETANRLGISLEASRKRLQRAEAKYRKIVRDSTRFDGIRQSENPILCKGGAENV
ncbi:MAG: RNA polymerase sigma factor [Ruminococcaceae bacterium]|nr:RNA polymerase sigma factor [Oscillospiraceae bacterium]